jgi:hypothetical protein
MDHVLPWITNISIQRVSTCCIFVYANVYSKKGEPSVSGNGKRGNGKELCRRCCGTTILFFLHGSVRCRFHHYLFQVAKSWRTSHVTEI